jgi:hypothetical protein
MEKFLICMHEELTTQILQCISFLRDDLINYLKQCSLMEFFLFFLIQMRSSNSSLLRNGEYWVIAY